MNESVLNPGDEARRGALIVFEGLDGSGKTTQTRRLEEWLLERGLEVDFSFEPTNGPHGLALRNAWARGERHDPQTELELFEKDRRRHVRELIAPGLHAGHVVVLDRYYYSSAAYQGVRGGADPERIIRQMTEFAPRPDLTLVFDMEVDEALERITGSRADMPNVMERREDLRRVREAFARMDLPEIRRVDASRDQDAIYSEIIALVGQLLRERGLLPD